MRGFLQDPAYRYDLLEYRRMIHALFVLPHELPAVALQAHVIDARTFAAVTFVKRKRVLLQAFGFT